VTTPALKLGELLWHHQHFMCEMKFSQWQLQVTVPQRC